MRPSFVAFILAFSCLHAFAQGDFRDGYVILANGDSISGKVAYRSSAKNSSSCKFKPASGNVITYTPAQVRAYGYLSDKRFEVRVLPDDTVAAAPAFVEVVIKGYMSLLHRNHTLYVEVNGKIVLLPIPVDRVVSTDKGRHLRKDSRYKGLLNSLLIDCALKADNSRYDQVEIGYLVQNYNRCHNQPGTYYKETKARSLFTYQAFGGIQTSKMISDADGKSLASSVRPMAGISVDISAPKIFDRMFLSLECVYSSQYFQIYQKTSAGGGYLNWYSDTRIDQTVLKFPLGIRYNFFNDYQTLYIKGGVIYGLILKWNIEEIKEEETPTQVTTSVTSLNPDGGQTGLFGAVGFSQGIRNKLRGFVEVRYEKMKTASHDIKIGYYNTSIYISAGVRF